MTNYLRVVVDTNVVVSGLFAIKNSPSSQILQAFRSQKIILVTSSLILEEIGEVISRERIMKLTKMNDQQRQNFMEDFIKRADVTAGKHLSHIVARDVKDAMFLACAYEAQADYIVTGDKDLLALQTYEGTKIIRPRDFIDLLDKEGFLP